MNNQTLLLIGAAALLYFYYMKEPEQESVFSNPGKKGHIVPNIELSNIDTSIYRPSKQEPNNGLITLMGS